MEKDDRSGSLVVIEGIDSSGKKTQAKKLVENLKDGGNKVKYVEFPSYGSSELGEVVSQFLRGEFGDRDELPVEVISMFYAMDRYQFKEEYEEFLSEGGIIVANRYYQSNIAFQSTGFEGDAFKEIVDWIKNLGSRLPQPDQVFIMDMDPEIAQGLMAEKDLRDYLKGMEKDINEEKLGFQRQVAENYLKLAEMYGWTVIECDEDRDLRSIEEISDEIWSRLDIEI
ncbi:MAG: dTMP kinase [Candidatus Nanohaloarchaea archaeon]